MGEVRISRRRVDEMRRIVIGTCEIPLTKNPHHHDSLSDARNAELEKIKFERNSLEGIRSTYFPMGDIFSAFVTRHPVTPIRNLFSQRSICFSFQISSIVLVEI